ncbi:hypothetical protein AB0N05_16495 [Nocardia sp. NPDC051030]|uniref:hypothetical protein n=1 Tax=Nocardia sp. NPDC051030 TaxID=3155162 RepID=UPI00343FC8C6
MLIKKASIKRTRKSTAILISVWLVTFVLYMFVKPEGHDNSGTPPIVNTVLSNYLPNGPER